MPLNNKAHRALFIRMFIASKISLVVILLPFTARANVSTFGYKVQTPGVMEQNFNRPVVIENGLPYLVEVDENGVEQRTLLNNPMLGYGVSIAPAPINNNFGAQTAPQPTPPINPGASNTAQQASASGNNAAPQAVNQATNTQEKSDAPVMQLDTHKFLGSVHSPGAIIVKTESKNNQPVNGPSITITQGEFDVNGNEIKPKNKQPDKKPDQPAQQPGQPVMIMADIKHPHEASPSALSSVKAAAQDIFHTASKALNLYAESTAPKESKDGAALSQKDQNDQRLNAKQRLALKRKLPMVKFKEAIDWKFQMTPPNIGQKVYAAPNNHLIPVTFQPEIDIKAFYYTKNSQDIHILRALLEQIEDINMQDHNGNTLLMYTISYANHDALILLLQRGIDPEIANNAGFNALHLASHLADETSTIALIQNGTNVNATDAKGNTPIMYAAASGSINVVKRLLDNWALLNVVNHRGSTVLDFADTAPNKVVREYINARY